MKLTLNKIFILFFIGLTLFIFLIFYMQYSYSQNILTQNFINKHHLDSIKIKDRFKTLLDEIQYKFKVHQDEDLKKLDALYLLYSKKFNASKVAKILNEDVTFGHYEVFLINRDYKVVDASYLPDIGFDLGKFEVYRKILDDVFEEKKRVDISPLHLDISSLNLKKYYLILSPDKKYLLQLAFVVDVYKEAKKLYHKILKDISNLKELNVFYIEKYLIYNIDFSKRYNPKVSLDIILKNTENIVTSIAKELNIKVKIRDIPTTLKEIFKKKHIKLNLNSHSLVIYTLIEGVFNKEDSMVVVRSVYNTKTLEKDIWSLRKRFLFLFLMLIIAIALGYYFIIHKISTEIKNIATCMVKNKEIENEGSFIEEIEVLKKEYNNFRALLNEEIQKNVKLLENNKRFILDTIHQIKTPLSIMTLNLDFIKTQVNDEIKEILEEIEAAVTMLNNSYEDLSYLAGNGVLKYEAKEAINVCEVLKERIKFFEAVANANNKKIIVDIDDEFMFKINKVELDRIIDNNLSNAIKYSTGKEIEVTFKNGVLKFASFGERIKGKNLVFEKNYREHSHKRGLGIGLSIVKEICEKYRISYRVYYENGKNIFEYKFGKIS